VRIKPTSPAWEVKPRESDKKNVGPKGLNEIAKKSWQELLDKLAPDSDLRKAVEQLLKNRTK